MYFSFFKLNFIVNVCEGLLKMIVKCILVDIFGFVLKFICGFVFKVRKVVFFGYFFNEFGDV